MVVRRGGTEWGRGGGGGEAWREERRIRGEGGIVTGARRRAESISGYHLALVVIYFSSKNGAVILIFCIKFSLEYLRS
jgi:hypothetical protein